MICVPGALSEFAQRKWLDGMWRRSAGLSDHTNSPKLLIQSFWSKQLNFFDNVFRRLSEVNREVLQAAVCIGIHIVVWIECSNSVSGIERRDFAVWQTLRAPKAGHRFEAFRFKISKANARFVGSNFLA